MQKTINAFFKLLEFLVVACLVAMVIMVFGNVVLRYGFNSGISISDEVSRYCAKKATWAWTRWCAVCRSVAKSCVSS